MGRKSRIKREPAHQEQIVNRRRRREGISSTVTRARDTAREEGKPLTDEGAFTLVLKPQT